MTIIHWSWKNMRLLEIDKKMISDIFSEIWDYKKLWIKVVPLISEIIILLQWVIDWNLQKDIVTDIVHISDDVKKIYGDIAQVDWMVLSFFKKIPLITRLIHFILKSKNISKIELQYMEEEAKNIWQLFAHMITQLTEIIDRQNTFLSLLDHNISLIIAYRDFIQSKLTEFQNNKDHITDVVDNAENLLLKEKDDVFEKNVEFLMNSMNWFLSNLDIIKQNTFLKLELKKKLMDLFSVLHNDFDKENLQKVIIDWYRVFEEINVYKIEVEKLLLDEKTRLDEWVIELIRVKRIWQDDFDDVVEDVNIDVE